MLGFLFGFNARIGRLYYFLGTIAVAFVMTGICYAIAGYALQSAARGTYITADLMTAPVITVAALFVWLNFTLQSMRIRDIGWDPVCVIPGWIAILIIDYLIASKIPAVALGHDHQGTVVGALVNLGLLLALLFWPGGDYQATPTSDDPLPKPENPFRRDTSAATASRIARVANGEFGRRA